ncbi:MAG: hypothetical protein WAN35_05490 [Terracidiphilus sp.]
MNADSKPRTPDELPLPESEDSAWEDLVVSILAVNQYSLEKTYACKEGLQAQVLTAPATLLELAPAEIERRLKAGGCDRGAFMTNLFAKRLAALGAHVRAVGIEQSTSILAGKSRQKIEQFLEPVNGIGPVVLRNFFLLRGI